MLAELRARELAFTRAETHDLLVTRGKIELGADEIGLLDEWTEGWPATLVLAGLWLGPSTTRPRPCRRSEAITTSWPST